MSEPLRASDLMRSVMRDLREIAGRSRFADVFDEVVGERLAARCRVAGYKNGRLWVDVDSAPLCAELTAFRREEIRIAMNERLEHQKIAQITFRICGTGHA